MTSDHDNSFIQKMRKLSSVAQEYVVLHAHVEEYQHKIVRFVRDLRVEDFESGVADGALIALPPPPPSQPQPPPPPLSCRPLAGGLSSNPLWMPVAASSPPCVVEIVSPDSPPRRTSITPNVSLLDENDPNAVIVPPSRPGRKSRTSSKQGSGRNGTQSDSNVLMYTEDQPGAQTEPKQNDAAFLQPQAPVVPRALGTQCPSLFATPLHLRAKDPVGTLVGDVWESINTHPHPFYVAQVTMEKMHVVSRVLVANDTHLTRPIRVRAHARDELASAVGEAARIVQAKRIAFMQDLQILVEEVSQHFTSTTRAAGITAQDNSEALPHNAIHMPSDYHVFATNYLEYGLENADLSKYTTEQIAFVRTRLLNEAIVLDLFTERLHSEFAMLKDVQTGTMAFNTRFGTTVPPATK
jgi:hypothetical protein